MTLKATSRPPLHNLSQTAMVKPQIFLVPGPWHGPEFMSVVATKLEALGYKIHARQFPAVGLSSPPKDLSEDIAALRDLVDLAIDNANGVIVICHSWGGIVTDSELVGWSKSERAAQGKKGVVVRVGYLSAFMPPMGKSLIDMIGGTYPPWFDLKVHVFASSANSLHALRPNRTPFSTFWIPASSTVTSLLLSRSTGLRSYSARTSG